MRLLITTLLVLATQHLHAQDEWIAPEGKILNYRTLTWADFQDKEDKEEAQRRAASNLRAEAYVCPAIYFNADSGATQDNGRVKFRFKVKCAFQSRAFVRESTKAEQAKSTYVLTHEQDHYDIALTYANKLQYELSSRDYHPDKYNEEINKVYEDLLNNYHKTQQTYDGEVNPEGRDDVSKQQLWDMRVKKALENNSDEYYSSPESAVQNVKAYGQLVKRIPGEPALQFVVRARPLYSEFPAEYTTKIVETQEWTPEPSIIAFYTQKYVPKDDDGVKEHYRTLALLFTPTGKNTYKRIFIDTLNNEGRPIKITATFLANADSDQTKELVIMASSQQKNGTLYMNRVYDRPAKLLPGKLKRLDDATAKLDGGLDDGKATKVKNKTEKEVMEGLKKMGY